VANGREVFNKVVDYDPVLMMNHFVDTFDRRLVWANTIDVDIPADPSQ